MGPGASIIQNIVHFIFADVWIIWAPLLFFYFAEHMWHHYVSEKFIAGIQWNVLEITVPREMKKNPLAMELFITGALFQHTEKGLWELFVQGAVWFWFSLEIASIDGQVHFYIRCPSRTRQLIESQLYAQFPQVEIKEVEDYTRRIPKLVKDGPYDAWGCEFDKKKHDVLPIKTYIDFGMDKDPKDEFKNDPLSGVLEYMASIKKGEEIWIQITIRASRKVWHTHGTLFGHHGYLEEMNAYLDRILEPYTKHSKDFAERESRESRTPDVLKPVTDAVNRASNKLPFDTGIRTMYVAKREAWDNNTRRGLRLMWRQYGSPHLNEFERVRSTQYDYPWQDPFGNNLLVKKNSMLTYYKLRVLFYPPFWLTIEYPILSFFIPSNKPKYYIMNTEELATIWHFPSRGTETPTLERSETRTAKPPANLPM